VFAKGGTYQDQLKIAEEFSSPFGEALEDRLHGDLWESLESRHANDYVLKRMLADEAVQPSWETIKTLEKYTINLRIPRRSVAPN
jgi:hypothetical protein